MTTALPLYIIKNHSRYYRSGGPIFIIDEFGGCAKNPLIAFNLTIKIEITSSIICPGLVPGAVIGVIYRNTCAFKVTVWVHKMFLQHFAVQDFLNGIGTLYQRAIWRKPGNFPGTHPEIKSIFKLSRILSIKVTAIKKK
jgi:hypothetical protein